MTASRLRIAFVNTLYPPHGGAGAEATLRMLAQALQSQRGHACSVVTLTPEKQASRGEVDGIAVDYLPLANVFWPHGGTRPRALRPLFQMLDAYNPVMAARLSAVLRRVRPDVVHCHNLQGFSVSAWRACRRLGIPVVQTLHDYYVACPRSAMWRPGRGNCATPCAECRVFATPRRALSALPTAVTAVSRRVLQRVVAAGLFADTAAGRPGVHIVRGNNASDELPPRPQPSRTDAPLRLGFIGRLDPMKGVERLLDAFRTLSPASATLRIAGGGDAGYVRRLQERAAGLDGVAFLGRVEPGSFYAEIDLLVIPSIWEDPFPRVFHEALAYGVPSLVTPLGGLPEVIEPGRTGVVAAAATADALADALQTVMQDREGLEAMRPACREAASQYAPARIVGEYEAILADAARQSRATAREVVAHGG